MQEARGRDPNPRGSYPFFSQNTALWQLVRLVTIILELYSFLKNSLKQKSGQVMLWGQQQNTMVKNLVLELGSNSGSCLLVDGVNLGSNFFETRVLHL